MNTYHTKRYPMLFTLQMNAEQKKLLVTRAKKLGVSAAEVIRMMIELK